MKKTKEIALAIATMYESQSSDEIALDDNKITLKDFIMLFETFPSLWNPNNKDYLNTEKKNEDLDKLLPIFRKIKRNATRKDLMRKINSLRSNYRKELKKIINSKRSGRGADYVYKSRSSTFHLLKFLAKIETPKLIKGNSSCAVIRKTSGNLISKQNELLSRACSLLSQPQPSVSSQDVNPLALVWSDKLKHLNPTQKLFAEKAIFDILFEAQLNNLQKHSVQINATHMSPATSTPYPYTSSPDEQKNHESEYLIPDNCETYTSPGTSTTHTPVLHLTESNLPFVHAQKTTLTTTDQKPKPVIHIQKSNIHFIHA